MSSRVKGKIMFFWFGSKLKIKNLEQGLFNCPQCLKQTPYTLKEAQRYFSIYSIPLIPLEIIARYAECMICHGDFKPSSVDGDERRDEIVNSRMAQVTGLLGGIGTITMIVWIVYGLSCMASDYQEKQATIPSVVNKNNPVSLMLVNSSDTPQIMRVLKGIDVDEIMLKKGDIKKWESNRESTVTVCVGKKSITARLDDPEMVNVICIDNAGRLRCVTESVEDFGNFEGVKNYLIS